jgi:hypothetical protein
MPFTVITDARVNKSSPYAINVASVRRIEDDDERGLATLSRETRILRLVSARGLSAILPRSNATIAFLLLIARPGRG